MQLPHGPWKQIFSGVWEGKEITYHENPDKKLLTMIYDKKGEEVKGVVLLLTSFYHVQGNPSNYALNSKENVVLIEKNTPTFKGSFIAVSTGPKYVMYSPRQLINESHELYQVLEQNTQNVRKEISNLPFNVVDIKFTESDVLHELFGEPLAIPATTVRKVGPRTVITSNLGHIKIGKTKEGNMIEEEIQNALLTVITEGDQYDREHVMQVIIEGCVLNGVSGVVLDKEGTYKNLDTPNPDTTKFTDFGMNVDPIGMPVRRFNPGTDLFIELNLLDGELFGCISGMGKGKASELIGRIIASRKPANIQELIDSLSAVEEKENKYYAHRAIRICKLLDNMYPRLFDGNMDPKEIVAPWLKKMGRVAILNVRGMEDPILKGIVYTILKTLYENYKEELASKELKVQIGVEIVKGMGTAGKGEYIDKEIEALIKLCGDFGIGVTLLADHELSVDTEIIENATLKVQCLGKSEIGVSSQDKRTYRAFLRPTLSAYVAPSP